MASASDGANVRRSQTATIDFNNGVALPSTEVSTGAPGSNPVQQPQAQQSGSNLGSAAQTEGVQSHLSNQQARPGVVDPNVITDEQWDLATGGLEHEPGVEEGELDALFNEDSPNEPSEASVEEDLATAEFEATLDAIINEPHDNSRSTSRVEQRPEQRDQEETQDSDGDANMLNNAPATSDARSDDAPPNPQALPANMEIDGEAQPAAEQPFEKQKVKCKTCKGKHAPPCNPEIVAAKNARKAQSQPAASSSRKRASEDADPEQPEGSKYPKRNRKADGLPWNWCYECQEEHPFPDADGTTHHTKTADDAMRMRNEQRRRAAESAGNPAAPTAQNTPQAPPQPPQQPRESLLRTMSAMPTAQEAYETALRSMEDDHGRINNFLVLFDSTRAAAMSQLSRPTAPPPVAASTAPAPYANAAGGLSQATYNFPPQARTSWPSQPPTGRGRGRGRGIGRGIGRGGRGGSAHSGQSTAQNRPAATAQANNTGPAATAAPSAPNGAQTGVTNQPPRANPATRHGQGERSNHQSAGPAGVHGGRGRGRGSGRGRGGSA